MIIFIILAAILLLSVIATIFLTSEVRAMNKEALRRYRSSPDQVTLLAGPFGSLIAVESLE